MNISLIRQSWHGIRRVWQRWTAPRVALPNIEDFHKASLLASVLLITTFITVIPLMFRYLVGKTQATPMRILIDLLVIGLILTGYFISRQGFFRVAALMVIFVGNVIIYVTVITLEADTLIALYYLVIILIFTSLFFSLRTMILAALAEGLAMLLLPILLPHIISLEMIARGPLLFLIIMSMIIVVFSMHRELLDTLRRVELSTSENRYRIVSELISDYAYSLRVLPNGKVEVEWMTDAYTVVTGYPLEELETSFAKSSHPDDLERARADLDAAVSGQSTSGDYRIITRSGETKWLNIYRRPEFDESGQRVVRIYGVAKDITERKHAESQRLELALQQERLTLLGRFVLATSQEFRTSLASIEVNRYLIQRKIDPQEADKVRDQLNQIRYYVSRLTGQLDNFHTVSALTDLKTEPRAMNTEISYIVSGYTMRAEEKRIKLDFQPDSALPPVAINVQEFGAALKALLDNALTYTTGGGQIHVRTRLNGQFALVEVEDTGTGIEPQHLPHIFEMFYRADPARPLETGGTGLGLSVVQMVAHAHKGKVEVATEPGKGSTFTLYLPLHPAAIVP